MMIIQPPEGMKAPAPVVNKDLVPMGRRHRQLIERWQDYLMQYGIVEEQAYDMALDCWRIMQAQ